jgi:hypothetical protein
VTTGTESSTGLLTRVWLPGEGTILTDTGRLLFDATGELIQVSAHHPIVLGDPSALASLCAALA